MFSILVSSSDVSGEKSLLWETVRDIYNCFLQHRVRILPIATSQEEAWHIKVILNYHLNTRPPKFLNKDYSQFLSKRTWEVSYTAGHLWLRLFWQNFWEEKSYIKYKYISLYKEIHKTYLYILYFIYNKIYANKSKDLKNVNDSLLLRQIEWRVNPALITRTLD